MVDQNETLKDALVRLLRQAGKCLTASELASLRQQEIGGGESIGESLIDAELSNAPEQVYKSGKKYCLRPKNRRFSPKLGVS